MKFTRRSLLIVAGAAASASYLFKRAVPKRLKVNHILPIVTDSAFAISVSVKRPVRTLDLQVDGARVTGSKSDTHGRFWSFSVSSLMPDTTYSLRLIADGEPVDEAWPLKTFPPDDALPDSFRLLAFTCAGGPNGLRSGDLEIFKPHAFRQQLFDAALESHPDAVLSIGDHIYWDLRGRGLPPFGTRRSGAFRFFAGLYLKNKYGEFNRSIELLGTKNEKVLTNIADEQIAELYGTRFRSTPIFFVSDDHDYFENDDAEEEIVTFPPDRFSQAAHAAVAKLYYPPLPNAPSREFERSFGILRYGTLFEAPLVDCAGHLDLEGEQAALVPQSIEAWMIGRAQTSSAVHFAYVPSHPMGWTAGKWREWYPDVVAPEGYSGVVTNALMGETQGVLSTNAQKYLWQPGWWTQHQRILTALAERPRSRFTFSGDIHAQGAIQIQNCGDVDLSEMPVTSILVGPVSTSQATWPSFARGIEAATPESVNASILSATEEVNGYTLFDIAPTSVRATLVNCGGHDPCKQETGAPINVREIDLI